MTVSLGTVKPGTTLQIPFDSFDGGDGSSSATSGLAVGDIKIYKDGSATERASTSGYAVTASFDSITGINEIEIDLADNTTGQFFACGSRYNVVVDSVTIDSQTVSFTAATFRIGYPGALWDTTVGGYTSQTEFVLTAGSARNDAYNGCLCYIHDEASDVDVQIGYVLDYVGASKTVTLAADPGVFTFDQYDNVSLMPPSNITAISGDSTAADNLEATYDGTGYADDNAPATQAALTTIDTVVDAIKAVTDNLPDSGALTTIGTDTARLTAARAAVLTDWINNGRLDLLLDAIPTTAMRGTDSAATATALATAQADLDILTGSDGVTLATAQANYAPSTVAALSTAQADLDILTGTDGATLATAQGNYAPNTVVPMTAALSQTEHDATQTAVGLIPTTAMRGTDNALLASTFTTMFSGITALAQWLGIIAGKQTGNSTARTELRATGAGSGTYDETTDSIEALRDRGDAAWITGNTTTPPTAVAIRTEIDSNSTQLAAIVADTDELQSDDVPGLIAALNNVSVSDVLTTQMTEAYAADGTAPTLAQAIFLIQQTLGDFSIAGTALTVKKIDGSTTAATFTLNDDTSPTSLTRTS